MLALLAPGQGAQTPGFLSSWLTSPGVARRVRDYADVLDLAVVELGTTAGAETLRDTAICQPVLVAVGLAVGRYLLDDCGVRPDALAGHSVGELTALGIAGVLDEADVLRLAAVRGRAMAASAARVPTGMAAVLGGDESAVTALAHDLGLEIANYNGAGQVVVGGEVAALELFGARLARPARVRPLAVAGAFHTRFMTAAVEEVAAHAASLTPREASMPVLDNADGRALTDGVELLRRVVAQIVQPVRFDAVLHTLTELGVTDIVELPPAGVLAGLARRGCAGADVHPLGEPVDAAALVTRLTAGEPAADLPWRLVVAPGPGTFLQEADVRDVVVVDASLGAVVTPRGEHRLSAPISGHVVEWLAHDGDLVREGQPLVRLAAGRA